MTMLLKTGRARSARRRWTGSKPEHFAPAYDRALAEHNAEIVGIAGDPSRPTSTTSSSPWNKAANCWPGWTACSPACHPSATNEALQAIELEMAPRLSAHWSAIYMNPALFARLDASVRRRADLELDAE